ncbi:hypothetical protein F5Y15DRAFT_147121 [Xylariaceae sp. FL0016]|nr:hypothetical protein F5Y15DRAFT_147121 [Xylariaceae sp. FL0016]
MGSGNKKDVVSPYSNPGSPDQTLSPDTIYPHASSPITTSISASTLTSTCAHTGRGQDDVTPGCWDCAEQGHVPRGPTSPTWESFRKLRKGFWFRQQQLHQNSAASLSPSQKSSSLSSSSAPEVHPPEEGIEVSTTASAVPPPPPSSSAPRDAKQQQQPGLIVVAGPRVVSPSEKFKKPSWGVVADSEDVKVPRADDDEKKKGGRIWGLERRTFQVLIAVVLVSLACMAVGVAVGLTRRNGTSGSTSLSKAGGSQTSTTAGPSATSTSSSDAGSSRDCIAPDGSVYQDPGTKAQFRVECGIAHQGADIENLEAETMQDCVSLCAENAGCAGAIWYNVGAQGTDLNYCWLKSGMDGELRYTSDAESVVRL